MLKINDLNYIFDLFFYIIFPLVLLGLIILIFAISVPKRKKDLKFMTFEEFFKEWLVDHGQSHRLDEVYEKAKKDPLGKLYQPITYKLGKFFAKLGLSANMVSILNLIITLFIFYLTIIAGFGHNYEVLTLQPQYGSLILLAGFLVLFAGIMDGVDGSIARLLRKQTKSGGWLDAVIDRICDILLIVGMIPGGFLTLPIYGIDLRWMAWTNIFLIFLYEYMRSKYLEYNIKEIQPFIGERPARILIQCTFYLIYGFSSFSVWITNFINPNFTNQYWSFSHPGIVYWCMIIFQINFLIIMGISIIKSFKWTWNRLKKADNEDKK